MNPIYAIRRQADILLRPATAVLASHTAAMPAALGTGRCR